jgi:hypothetical protein
VTIWTSQKFAWTRRVILRMTAMTVMELTATGRRPHRYLWAYSRACMHCVDWSSRISHVYALNSRKKVYCGFPSPVLEIECGWRRRDHPCPQFSHYDCLLHPLPSQQPVFHSGCIVGHQPMGLSTYYCRICGTVNGRSNTTRWHDDELHARRDRHITVLFPHVRTVYGHGC